jgi:hypothetical protein
MVNSFVAVKGKVKRLIANRNNFKYQRFDKPQKMSQSQRRPFLKNVLTIFHRLIVLLARFLFKNVFFGKRGKSVPEIKNLLLLDSASALALKIRTRKVTSVEVLKTFIERIKASSRPFDKKFCFSKFAQLKIVIFNFRKLIQ